MTASLERRIAKLEQGRGTGISIADAIRQADRRHREIGAALDAMSESDLRQLAVDETVSAHKRREALRRLLSGSEGQARKRHRSTLEALEIAEIQRLRQENPGVQDRLLGRIESSRLRVVAAL